MLRCFVAFAAVVPAVALVTERPSLEHLAFPVGRAATGRAGRHVGQLASGENRGIEAARKAISSPLPEDVSLNRAAGGIVNITGGPDPTLFDFDGAASVTRGEADEEADIVFGCVVDESLKNEVRVTVVATGFIPAFQAELGNPSEGGRAPGSGSAHNTGSAYLATVSIVRRMG